MKTYTIFEQYSNCRFEWLGSTFKTLQEAESNLEVEIARRGGGPSFKNGAGEPYKLIIEETEREDGWESDW